ncbi:hypothetical protein L7F22_030165 [Adiantum nelumboides]|nr:hypothetical protein [Adiantum nelumboides]
MPLEGCDVLLGMPWFYNHKAVLDSFNKIVTLEIRGRKIVLDLKLKGESVPLVSASAVPKLMKQHIFVYSIYVKERDETESSNLSSLDVSPRAFLDEYADCFSEALPDQLPHERLEDHNIDLIPGSAAPNKPPYRVSAAEQEEIVTQVNELLQKGYIQPSSSPFCSPVLLVQKKDGYWCMFIDYRALNKIIVKHKYPIPCIDDVLDRLQGASFFSRIDLKIGCHQIRRQSIWSICEQCSRKAVVFRFGERQQQAFKLLKEKLTTELVLILPDFRKTFQVQCDACGSSIGAVLMQAGHVNTYESRVLRGPEKHTQIYELLAVIHALESWKHYLLGADFTVQTDHQSLRYFLTKAKISEKRLSWANYLSMFHFQDAEKLCEQSEDCMGRLVWLQDQSCWYLPFTFLLRSDWPHPPSVVMWSIRDAAAIFGTQEDRLRTWTLEMVSGMEKLKLDRPAKDSGNETGKDTGDTEEDNTGDEYGLCVGGKNVNCPLDK